MNRRARLASVVLLAAMATLLVILFNRTQAIDIEAQNRVILSLRELEKLDAEWNVNILRSHIGLNPDYDVLSAPLPRMQGLLRQLEAALPTVGDPAAAPALAGLREALHEKEELVEEFKAHNAILHNSLIYFPPAVTDLKSELNGIGAALSPRREVAALDRALNDLLTDVLRYNLAPEPRLAERIDATLEHVLELRAPFAAHIRTSIEEVTAHASVIVRFRQLQNDLEARIAAIPTTLQADRLGALFDKAFDQVQLQRQRARTWLFAYSLALLALLFYVAWRLRRSYRVIGEVNRRLVAANETLEQRVAERTAELEERTRQLQKMAQHDSLTGLINYGELCRQLDHALVRAARRDSIVVVMFIDLDGFKAVNDTYGHAAGDLVLKEVARSVAERLRKEDAFARLGGDEFVILLDEVLGRDGALRVAEEALDAIRAIRQADSHPVSISASIGIASARGLEGMQRGAAALLHAADKAMYAAKQAGKDAIAISPDSVWEGAFGPVLSGHAEPGGLPE